MYQKPKPIIFGIISEMLISFILPSASYRTLRFDHCSFCFLNLENKVLKRLGYPLSIHIVLTKSMC